MWSIWRARSYKYISSIWKEDLVLKLCLYLHLPDEHSYPLPAFPSSKPIVFFWVIFQDNNNIRFQQDPGKRRICFSWNVFPWRKCSFITPSLSLSLSFDPEFKKSYYHDQTVTHSHSYVELDQNLAPPPLPKTCWNSWISQKKTIWIVNSAWAKMKYSPIWGCHDASLCLRLNLFITPFFHT